jgi:hypothetical protein
LNPWSMCMHARSQARPMAGRCMRPPCWAHVAACTAHVARTNAHAHPCTPKTPCGLLPHSI